MSIPEQANLLKTEGMFLLNSVTGPWPLATTGHEKQSRRLVGAVAKSQFPQVVDIQGAYAACFSRYCLSPKADACQAPKTTSTGRQVMCCTIHALGGEKSSIERDNCFLLPLIVQPEHTQLETQVVPFLHLALFAGLLVGAQELGIFPGSGLDIFPRKQLIFARRDAMQDESAALIANSASE